MINCVAINCFKFCSFSKTESCIKAPRVVDFDAAASNLRHYFFVFVFHYSSNRVEIVLVASILYNISFLSKCK